MPQDTFKVKLTSIFKRKKKRLEDEQSSTSGSQTPNLPVQQSGISRSPSPLPPVGARVLSTAEYRATPSNPTSPGTSISQLSSPRAREGAASIADVPSPSPGLQPGRFQHASQRMKDVVLHAGGDIAINNVSGNLTTYKDTPALVRLKDLLDPIDATHESYTSDQRATCFKNTRVKLLSEIEEWFTGRGDRDRAPIYVLDGIAGIGKSTIAQTVAERAAGLGILGASFFFTRNEVERMIAKHFFPTTAFHLACHSEEFARRIIEAVEKAPDAAQRSILQQFQLLILDPLKTLLAQVDHSVLIVIDALDECKEDEAELLLTLLIQHIHLIPGLRIFISTRPERHIRGVLEENCNHHLFHLHNIEDTIVQADIHLYLSSSLSVNHVQKAFPKRQPPWQPSDEDMEMLIGISGKLFIIASTAAKFLLDDKGPGPAEALACILDGVSAKDFSGSDQTVVMDKFYIQIIRAAAPHHNKEPPKWWIDRYQTAIGTIIVLQSPLPCSTIAQLLGNGITANYIEEALVHLHSLVAPTIGNSGTAFQVHHKSFSDFITNEGRIKQALSHLNPGMLDLAPVFCIKEKVHHLQLTKACLNVMDEHLKWNMANLSPDEWYHDKTMISDWSSKMQLISNELAYAVTHWSSHLQAAGDIAHQVKGNLENWANRHILIWLEVMSILERTRETYSILEQALDTMNKHTDSWSDKSRLQELLSDASRFVQQNGEILKASPMHIYWSGIQFTPGKTALFEVYQEANSAKVLGGIEEGWNATLSVMTGHSRAVITVAFSPDGSRLASGSHDNTVQLWDAKTGAHTTTLNGHSGVVAVVAFSPDGSRLASGSYDNTVQLWDAKTGAHVITLNGHSNQVTAVAISPDGSRLASGSHDNTVQLWNAKTGALVITLNGHSGVVAAVVFSPDGSRLASGSYDNTVQLWNTKTGAHVTTLNGHSSLVTAVAFSPDGSRLASGSYDNTVHVWDLKTAAHVPVPNSHSNRVTAVAFSPDTSRIASGSWDNTVQLWDAKTGAHVTTLIGHSGWVNAVAFSPDGSRLASGSHDKTVQLWNTKTGAHVTTLNGYSDAVNAVAFSPDGSRLASGSQDKTMQLWDAKTVAHVITLSDHSREVIAVTFSPDGSRLASGDDNTVQLWDARTGAHVTTLSGHSNLVTVVAFSPDGSRLASISDDKTMQLWDAEYNCCLNLSDSLYLDQIVSIGFFPCSSSPSKRPTVNQSSPATGSIGCLKIILTVQRKNPLLSGLVVVKLQADGSHFTYPICWFPANLHVVKTSLSLDGTLVAAGCENGRVLLLDISRIPL